MPNVTLNEIRYNATAGAFQARVDIQRGEQTFRYPCELAGPMSLDPSTVRRSLIQQAQRMSDSGASLRSVF